MKHASVLAVCVVIASASNGYADRIAELTPRQQFLQAEVVVVGKVAEIEGDLVKANGVGYQIASVKISEGLVGAKGLTHVRVGFIPVVGGGLPPGPRGFRPGFNLTSDQECCFLLKKLPSSDFYVYIPNGYPVNKNQPAFDAELKVLKQMASIRAEPIAALKAKEAADRQFAACLLVLTHRTRPSRTMGTIVEEPIPTEESKLILQALGSMEWGQFDQNGIATLSNAFYMLQLTERDGWKQPQPMGGQDINKALGEAARKWFTENAEKYQIRRFVVKSK